MHYMVGNRVQAVEGLAHKKEEMKEIAETTLAEKDGK